MEILSGPNLLLDLSCNDCITRFVAVVDDVRKEKLFWILDCYYVKCPTCNKKNYVAITPFFSKQVR